MKSSNMKQPILVSALLPSAVIAHISLIAWIGLIACTKTIHTTPTPAFSVTAAINGVPTSFNAIITVDTSTTSGTLYIVAHSDSANLTPLLEITLSDSTKLTPGVYTPVPGAHGSQGLVGYTGWFGNLANQYNASSDTVTLTTVNKTWLSGTFQGTCAYTADSTVSVTNGQFTVGWKEQ
jgi:hypothetical protein